MKHEVQKAETRPSTLQSPAARSTRVSKTKDTQKPEPTNAAATVAAMPGLRTRPKHAIPQIVGNHRTLRKPVLPSKFGSIDGLESSPKEREVVAAPAPVAAARPRLQRRRSDVNCKVVEEEIDDVERRELKERLSVSENLVGALQSEVLSFKNLMEKLQSLNAELESQNKQYAQELSAAHAKISALERANQVEVPEFKDVRNLIAHKLENLRSEKDSSRDFRTPKVPNLKLQPVIGVAKPHPRVAANGPPPPPPPPPPPMPSTIKNSPTCGPPPPPPPPPPRHAPAGAATMQKSKSLVEFYHSLTKRDRERGPSGAGNSGGSVVSQAHSSIVGEIQNRSAHLLAIKADVETKGDFIKSLIEIVQSAAYTNVEDVSAFVDWLDKELSTLADESAVLKHFNWPERKADAMREAACEYRALKRLEVEVGMFEDDLSMTFESALKKMANLLNKLERSIQRLVKLRDVSIPSYGLHKIPTEWMLDSGMSSKIKLASVKLAKVCMKRASLELKSVRHSEKETIQESLLLQCVRFAYRVHQFAGGLDMETMSAFEELRQRIHLHGRESCQLLPSISVP